MGIPIKKQGWKHLMLYLIFGLMSFVLMMYYLSNTLIHFTSSQQFPINSFKRFPLTFLIFPAELFSFCFAMYFVYNLFTDRYRNEKPEELLNKSSIRVAVLIPVYNEPREIVERTIAACKKLIWPGGVRIYLLDDSSSEEDMASMKILSKYYGCMLVRRSDRTGFKAGNINNAIKNAVREEYFVVFDSDQAPEPKFLEEVMDYFSNISVGFVQTPQHFINVTTPLERAAKIGTDIFYNSQCVSKAHDGALPFCGTNAVIRTSAFLSVNGFSYFSSTEDIELGLRLNSVGYFGIYVPKILVYGYAPPDFVAYSSQQYRWANGNLAILREHWKKILFGKFNLRQQIHTVFTLGWWVIGIVTLIYVIVPILSLLLGGTHHTWLPTTLLLLLFLNVVTGISMIYFSQHARNDNDKIRISDAFLQYSLITNSMFIYIKAAINVLLGRYVGFIRTNKKRTQSGWWKIKWNLLLSAICFGFSTFALYHAAISSDMQQIRTYLPVSIWLLFYSVMLASSIIFVGYDLPKKNEKPRLGTKGVSIG
ncbi:MAG TPA: cellulose synthase catalytic subunit [Candidatus Nanoarchaeia archaeon]|nr:cellulose synthase catalytic subunit [Candidatus Nanoarchaeia archaeon]